MAWGVLGFEEGRSRILVSSRPPIFKVLPELLRRALLLDLWRKARYDIDGDDVDEAAGDEVISRL